jgi:hypothetical protein
MAWGKKYVLLCGAFPFSISVPSKRRVVLAFRDCTFSHAAQNSAELTVAMCISSSLYIQLWIKLSVCGNKG